MHKLFPNVKLVAIIARLSLIYLLLGQIAIFLVCSGAALLLLICQIFRGYWGKLSLCIWAKGMYVVQDYFNVEGIPQPASATWIANWLRLLM